MDALPISVNQKQLSLMHDAVEQMIKDLQTKQNGGQFSSSDETQKEHNILTYGTNEYDEVFARAQNIENQLKSHLESWNGRSDDPAAISLELDSYQLKMLRSSLKQMFHGSNNEQQTQSGGEKQLFEDVIEQLPEHSPQEDAD